VICWCGHSIDWEHYHRSPGNGQQFDDVCVWCLINRNAGVGNMNIDPWHKGEEVKSP